MKDLEEKLKQIFKNQNIGFDKPYLANLMWYLMEDVDIKYGNQEAMEMVLVAFYTRFTDEKILKFLNLEASELSEQLNPEMSKEELRDLLLLDVLWDAMATRIDNFPYQKFF